MIDMVEAEKSVARWAEEHALEIGFLQVPLKAKYIWNPGGFINQSFYVTDGSLKRHLKLAQSERVSNLQRWRKVHSHLTQRYGAPELIAEIKEEIVTGYPYGLVFEYIESKSNDAKVIPDKMLQQLLFKLNSLHQDGDLRALLKEEHINCTVAEAFVSEYVERFEKDIEVIHEGQHLLTFVPADRLLWFSEEVSKLKDLIQNNPLFQMQSTDVVHNDIHWNNILIDSLHRPRMIDWDDISVSGDAAMDFSVLLWPKYDTDDWPYWREQVLHIAGEEMMARMELYFRAKLLDDVIDVLADFVEAEKMPEAKEKTQARAKIVHMDSYCKYIERY